MESIALVARVLHRSKPHLQSMLQQSNAAVIEDFFDTLVCLLVLMSVSLNDS